MIPVSLADLISRPSEADLLETALEVFRGFGFDVDSWQTGGVAHTIVRLLAKLLWQVTSIASQIAGGGYLDTATGAWLTLVARSAYQEERARATYAVQTCTLTSAVGSPPYTIVPNQIWVTNADGTLRFNNTTGGILASGGTLPLQFKAESPGTSYNLTPGTITKLITALPGVTITNTALHTRARDEQRDDDLKAICRLKWATLAAQMPTAAYEYWALKNPDGTARDGVTRAVCDAEAPDGPNTLRVYLAGPDGPVSEQIRSEVDADLQLRKAIGATVATLSATERAIAVTGVVYLRGVTQGVAETQGELALAALIQATPIGGNEVNGGARGVFSDDIIRTLWSVPGVVRVALTSGDFAMGPYEVAVGDWSGLDWQVL